MDCGIWMMMSAIFGVAVGGGVAMLWLPVFLKLKVIREDV